MNPQLVNTSVSGPTRPPRVGASTLLRVYLIRGIIAVGWSIGFSSVSSSLTAAAVAFLIVYPLIDVVASLVDSSAHPGTSARKVQLLNAGLSALATVALAIAAASGVAAVLYAFGAWAIVSGVVQVIVALRRRGPQMGRQWPMLVAGVLSVAAGFVFNISATVDNPQLDNLVTYTAAGGTFFVIQAGLLAWRLRKAKSVRA